jgi:hypothetical protein
VLCDEASDVLLPPCPVAAVSVDQEVAAVRAYRPCAGLEVRRDDLRGLRLAVPLLPFVVFVIVRRRLLLLLRGLPVRRMSYQLTQFFGAMPGV